MINNRIPGIETERLVLRGFTPADAADVQRLAGEREIAATTAMIPHPYEDGMAEEWIGGHEEEFRNGRGVTFAITDKETGDLVGAIGLTVRREYDNAEMGYWVGKPFWNRGYCTEAAGAILRYGFEDLALHRIYARHFGNNPASGRVLEKIGMRREGCQRRHFKKWGEYLDAVMYGCLREDYENFGEPSGDNV
jgi:RimJ/RimL family protein N-acetyltransferase